MSLIFRPSVPRSLKNKETVSKDVLLYMKVYMKADMLPARTNSVGSTVHSNACVVHEFTLYTKNVIICSWWYRESEDNETKHTSLRQQQRRKG